MRAASRARCYIGADGGVPSDLQRPRNRAGSRPTDPCPTMPDGARLTRGARRGLSRLRDPMRRTRRIEAGSRRHSRRPGFRCRAPIRATIGAFLLLFAFPWALLGQRFAGERGRPDGRPTPACLGRRRQVIDAARMHRASDCQSDVAYSITIAFGHPDSGWSVRYSVRAAELCRHWA